MTIIEDTYVMEDIRNYIEEELISNTLTRLAYACFERDFNKVREFIGMGDEIDTNVFIIALLDAREASLRDGSFGLLEMFINEYNINIQNYKVDLAIKEDLTLADKDENKEFHKYLESIHF